MTYPGGVRGAPCVRYPQQSPGSGGKGNLVHTHSTHARFEQCILLPLHQFGGLIQKFLPSGNVKAVIGFSKINITLRILMP